MSTTLHWLQTTLIKDYGLNADQLTPEASLEELGVDSLGVMELFFAVEDAFQISVPQEQVALISIGDVADYIDRLIATQHPKQDAQHSPEDAIS